MNFSYFYSFVPCFFFFVCNILNKYLNKINEVFLMRFFIILFIMIFSNNLFSANFEFALGVGAGATTEFSYALDKEENNMSRE